MSMHRKVKIYTDELYERWRKYKKISEEIRDLGKLRLSTVSLYPINNKAYHPFIITLFYIIHISSLRNCMFIIICKFIETFYRFYILSFIPLKLSSGKL